MYIPAHFKPDDAAVHELLSQQGAADLITSTEQGLLATMLPFLYDAPDSREGLGPLGGRGGSGVSLLSCSGLTSCTTRGSPSVEPPAAGTLDSGEGRGASSGVPGTPTGNAIPCPFSRA